MIDPKTRQIFINTEKHLSKVSELRDVEKNMVKNAALGKVDVTLTHIIRLLTRVMVYLFDHGIRNWHKKKI